MNSRDIIEKVRDDGWIRRATKGSHQQGVHPTKQGKVTVPHARKDIPLGTLRSIYRQAD